MKLHELIGDKRQMGAKTVHQTKGSGMQTGERGDYIWRKWKQWTRRPVLRPVAARTYPSGGESSLIYGPTTN